MVRLLSLFAALAIVTMGATPALAQTEAETATPSELESRAADAMAVLGGTMMPEDVFSDSFLTSVPPVQLAALNGQLVAQFGPFVGVESVEQVGPLQAKIVYRFERALGYADLRLSEGEDKRIVGLLVSRFEPVNDSAQNILSALQELPGTTNALLARVEDDGSLTEIVAHNADRQLALGSTFKLYVLSALTDAIAEGRLAWDQVVPLTARSFPSGMLQDWPEGAPVTVQTLATLMISISDNTATDQLIALVGREAVEAELIAAGNADPARSTPFMTTRELFVLKASEAEELGTYSGLSTAERRAVLAALDLDAVTLEDIVRVFADDPVALDVEWFASPYDIARVFARIDAQGDETALAVMGVNSSIPEGEREQWDYVGYKGGSEPGVLNLSWLLKGKDGSTYVATLGWNDPAAPVTNETLELLGQRLVALARQ